MMHGKKAGLPKNGNRCGRRGCCLEHFQNRGFQGWVIVLATLALVLVRVILIRRVRVILARVLWVRGIESLKIIWNKSRRRPEWPRQTLSGGARQRLREPIPWHLGWMSCLGEYTLVRA